MSFAPAALAAFRSHDKSVVVLASIAPRDPATLVASPVYVSTSVCTTPAGTGVPARYWLPLLVDVSPISAPGSFGDSDLSLCTGALRVHKSAFAAGLLLDGARVSIWLWEDSRDETGAQAWTTFDLAPVVLAEAEVVSYTVDAETYLLSLRQRTNWNRDLVPVEVTPEVYPHAPEDSIGQNIPIVYGRVSDVPFRAPLASYPSVVYDGSIYYPSGTRYLSLFLGGRRAGAAILVDTGRGAGATVNPKARVAVASHKCRTVNDLSVGCGVYELVEGKLAPIVPVDPVADVFNAADGAGILIPDNAAVAWISALPTDVEIVANSAENPRAVLDPFNDTNYAKLDWTAGYKTIRMKLPTLSKELGEPAGVHVFVGYRSPANTNLTIRFRNTVLRNADGSPYAAVDTLLPASANFRAMATLVWRGTLEPDINNLWNLGDVNLEVGWPTTSPVVTGTGTAEVYFAGCAVVFKPRQNVVESERVFEHTETRPVTRKHGKGRGGETTVWEPYTVRETIPATTELLGKFFANVEGYADDGEVAPAGTFTGTANALIERAPDVLAHILARYGGEPIANIETGPSSFGSFVAARAKLLDPRGSDLTFAFSVSKSTDVMTAIAWVAQSSASLVYLDRFSNRWRFIPWSAAPTNPYDWTFRPIDVVEGTSLSAAKTPTSRVISGVSLGYGYDVATRSFQHSTRLAWNGSTSGHKYRGLRDGDLSVVAGTNDKLDFATSGAKTATLIAGDYDGVSFASMLSTAMKTADPTNDFCVVWGATIVSGYNDELYFRDVAAGTDRTVTIPEGVYDFPGLCAYLGVATGTVLSFAYSRATRKVTISAPGSATLYLSTGTLAAKRFYLTFGFLPVGSASIGGATTATGDYERAEEFFSISILVAAIDLLWETGPNGLKGLRKNCASLCGFRTMRDANSGGATASWLGDSPKTNSEIALRTTASRYGARRDTVEDLRAVFETDTAREIRDRIANLLGKPRVVVTFSTDKAPDMERGKTIAFSGDFDAIVPYPDADSDGSWSGKKFVVVEVEQSLGPVAFYSKIRAVSLD